MPVELLLLLYEWLGIRVFKHKGNLRYSNCYEGRPASILTQRHKEFRLKGIRYTKTQ